MTTHYLDIVDPSFPLDLNNSFIMSGLVAGKLAAQGHEVTILAKKVRPNAWVRAKYADKGDIVVDGRPVDVKWRPKVLFREMVSQYPNAIVTPTKEWDRNPLHAVVQVDKQGDFMVIHGATHCLWTRETCFDTYKGRRRENYHMDWKYLYIQPWDAPMVI